MKEILDEPHPDCIWVFNGEGIATKKYDGTCVKLENGRYYKRREIKKGKQVLPKFIEEQFDEVTGKRVGWIEIEPTEKENKWHMEAFDPILQDGTYELLGPKIQGNPENAPRHMLLKHTAALQYPDAPRTFYELFDWFKDKNIEGLVFHHPDGRMGKIKKKDFGLRRLEGM